MVNMPWVNHSWHVALYVTARGLTTMPFHVGARALQIDFDFIDHQLRVISSDGGSTGIELRPMTVAEFYRRLSSDLQDLGCPVTINTRPNEVADPVPFDRDERHDVYDPDYVTRFWRILVQVDRVLRIFRSRYIGKCSPVHFFWGSFDLAVTRFSGREAPAHPGGFPNMPDWVTREAYSHEVSSCGFWAGGESSPDPVFYSYAYPVPEGFADAPILPPAALFLKEMGEFILPYEEVCGAESPDDTLLEFLQSSYEAAADCAGWDRKSLEKELPGNRS
jgi:hypothetical protein